MRATIDGEVICGGEDEEFSDEKRRDAAIPKKTARLQKKLSQLLPDIDPRAAFRWTGCFGSTDTGMPIIGQIPAHPCCYAVLGYGGNGITFSMLAARFLRAAILGRPDPEAKRFAFR